MRKAKEADEGGGVRRREDNIEEVEAEKESSGGRNHSSSLPSEKEEKSDADKIHKEIDIDWRFKIFVEIAILLNAVQLGVCVQSAGRQSLERACVISENIFVTVFVVEVGISISLMGFTYFHSKWNKLDFSLIVMAVVDSWIISPIFTSLDIPDLYVLRLVRLHRVFRVLKVLRSRKELEILMEGLMGALASICWVATLLAFFIYVTSIICVTLYQDVDFHSDVASKLTFESMPRALFTLFSLSIVADWTDIVMPVIEAHPEASLVFVAYVTITSLCILNLIVAYILERTTLVQQQHQEQVQCLHKQTRMENIEQIAKIIFREDNDEMMSGQEMEDLMRSPRGEEIKELLGEVELPEGYEIQDFHAMFDKDTSHSLTRHEFVHGMKRLIFSNDFQRNCMMQSSIAEVLVEMKALEARLRNVIVGEFEKMTKEAASAQRGTAGGCGGSGGYDEPLLQPAPSRSLLLLACRELVDRLQQPLVVEGAHAEDPDSTGHIGKQRMLVPDTALGDNMLRSAAFVSAEPEVHGHRSMPTQDLRKPEASGLLPDLASDMSSGYTAPVLQAPMQTAVDPAQHAPQRPHSQGPPLPSSGNILSLPRGASMTGGPAPPKIVTPPASHVSLVAELAAAQSLEVPPRAPATRGFDWFFSPCSQTSADHR